VAKGRTGEDKTMQEGLCADCTFARTIESARGSQFILCELSRTDPAFRKYPRLPVFECTGYVPKPRRGEQTGH
jgi:hypothetical protein